MNTPSESKSDDAVLVGQESEGSERTDRSSIIKNLGLAQRFVSAVYADPSLLDDFSSETTVVLIPKDDPELAAINLRGGAAMQLAGKPVRFVYV